MNDAYRQGISPLWFAATIVAFLVFAAHYEQVSSADELQPFEDRVTGVTLAIPRELMGREKRTEFGLNWHSENLSIDTLAFPSQRSLKSVYETIKARPGRRLVKDEFDEMEFTLEGVDRDGTRFIVRVRDNEIRRGLSVVYSSRGGEQLERTARQIADSFQFEGSVLDPKVPTARYLEQARDILRSVARDPSEVKRRWTEFGVVTRKYRLRVGRAAANKAIQTLFKEFPTSPLLSAVWGSLPLGILADLSQHKYLAATIYGPKTEYPNIRLELLAFLTDHPNDPFAFAAHYGVGAFDEAISGAERRGMPLAMLNYAAAHKKLATVLKRVTPNLDPIPSNAQNAPSPNEKDCPTDDARSRCFFYETFTVLGGPTDRLPTFLARATRTDRAKVRLILESEAQTIKQIVGHLERAASLGGGLPHEDDANYYLGVIFRFLGQKTEALARLDASFASPVDAIHRDYAFAARRQLIQMLLEISEEERISFVQNSRGFFKDPAIWYVVARDAYRRFDYAATIKIAEMGLERLGIELWRLPVTTERKRIDDELSRLVPKEPGKLLDVNLAELVYLLNASREIQRFILSLQQRGSSIDPKAVRSVVMKYSLLTFTEKEQERLSAGRLGQHRDLRQGVHLAELALTTIPRSASPELDRLREWLMYRKIRMLVQFEPKNVETAVLALERAYPRSTLLDDAYVELLYTQAFILRAPDTVVDSTFRLIAERFATDNAADNAYNWYAVYLECKKDYQNARRMNLEIIRRFPLTRHAINAASRLATPQGCSMWHE